VNSFEILAHYSNFAPSLFELLIHKCVLYIWLSMQLESSFFFLPLTEECVWYFRGIAAVWTTETVQSLHNKMITI